MFITRSHFKQSEIPTLITRSYVVGYFVNAAATAAREYLFESPKKLLSLGVVMPSGWAGCARTPHSPGVCPKTKNQIRPLRLEKKR